MVIRKKPGQSEGADSWVGFKTTSGVGFHWDDARSETLTDPEELVRMAARVLSLSQAHDPRKRRRIIGPATEEAQADRPRAQDPTDRMVAEVAEVTRMSEADVARVIAAWRAINDVG